MKNAWMIRALLLTGLALAGCQSRQPDADQPGSEAPAPATESPTASMEEQMTGAGDPANDSPFAFEGEGFYRMYQGQIGGYPVTMHLTRRATYYGIDTVLRDQIYGHYYYDRYQQPISLIQYWPDEDQAALQGKLVLYENYQAMDNPQFVGELTDSKFSGVWRDGNQEKELPFELKPVYLPGSVLLDVFYAGDYRELDPAKNESPAVACNLSMLFPSSYGDIEGAWETLYRAIVPRMTSEPADAPMLDNPIPKLRQVRNAFMQEHMEAYRKEPEFYDFFNDLTQYQTVLWNQDFRVCLGFYTYTFTGGAHGMYGTEYVNIDLRKQREISLSDVFQPGYERVVGQALERAARRTYDIPAGEPLSSVFDTDSIEPGSNFALTGKGILFAYTPYEIGAYALGQVELFVPFSELTSVLQPAWKQ